MPFAVLSLVAALAAGASDAPPAAFAGYSHPQVTADNCRVKDPGHVSCLLPAKTAGRYLVTATGVSTATAAGAVQVLGIGGQGWACGQIASRKGDWASGARTFAAQCEVTVLSDAAFDIDVIFAGPNTKLDPAGPKVVIRNVPWSGVLQTSGIRGGVLKPQAAPGAAAPRSSAGAAPIGR